jgi:hypothetical protein
MVSPYQELRRLVPTQAERGIAIGGAVIPAAQQLLDAQGLAASEGDSDTDRRLLNLALSSTEPAAFLCLRCRISHPLEAKLRGFQRQYGEHYGLDLIDLASYALDDDGRQLIYADIALNETVLVSPFTAEVLRTYKPGFCGLPHWARLKLQAHNGLKAYFREHGLLLISDWALLADSSGKRVREAWISFGAAGFTADHAVALHQAYKTHYPSAKASHQQATGKASGWIPAADFLQLIAPEQTIEASANQLKVIAHTLRLLKSGQWQRSAALADELEAELPDPATLPSTEEQYSATELSSLINAALQRALDNFLPSELHDERRRFGTEDDRRMAWELYVQGLSQRDIAPRCGHQQAWASKLFKEKQRSTAISTAAAVELKRHPAFASVGSSVEGAERLVEALRNHLVEPEREGGVAPLRRWIQEYLNKP